MRKKWITIGTIKDQTSSIGNQSILLAKIKAKKKSVKLKKERVRVFLLLYTVDYVYNIITQMRSLEPKTIMRAPTQLAHVILNVMREILWNVLFAFCISIHTNFHQLSRAPAFSHC